MNLKFKKKKKSISTFKNLQGRKKKNLIVEWKARV